MPTRLFSVLRTSDESLLRHHTRLVGDIDSEYPWDSLDPTRYPKALLERARLGWTENAFNEYCTGAALCEMLAAVMAAGAPLELWTLASAFPMQEILHVELCSRIAMILGGGAPVRFDERQILCPLDRRLTAFQRANELVVRHCCVGEAFSMPMLTGCMDSATHPLTKAVLTQIVKDEVMHGRFGFLYLDWAGPRMDDAERARLGVAASRTIAGLKPIYENLHSTVRNGRTTEGFLLSDVTDMGWMESSLYKTRAQHAMREQVVDGLAKYGIHAQA